MSDRTRKIAIIVGLTIAGLSLGGQAATALLTINQTCSVVVHEK